MGDPMEGAHAASTDGHRGMRAGRRRVSAPLILPTALTSSNVSKVEPAPAKWRRPRWLSRVDMAAAAPSRRRLPPAFDNPPVDRCLGTFNKFRSHVVVIQVVRVFPHVNNKEGHDIGAGGDEGASIMFFRDLRASIIPQSKPNPTTTEMTCSCGFEFLFESFHASKGFSKQLGGLGHMFRA